MARPKRTYREGQWRRYHGDKDKPEEKPSQDDEQPSDEPLDEPEET